MNLEEILMDKNFWFMENKNYNVDKDWVVFKQELLKYPAFKWKKVYLFRTPMLYFHISLRKLVKEFFNERMNKIQKAKCKYSVVVTGGEAGIPLPLELWGENDDFLKGSNMYINCFYIGEKYKPIFKFDYYEEEYNSKGVPSGLICGFNYIKNAYEFLEEWKHKLINDHKQEIKIQKELINQIK